MIILSSIELKNFRAFHALPPTRLWPLTFIVGPNSSGKTSLLHSIMLLAQSDMPQLERIEPVWNGGMVDLGSFEDAVWKHHIASPIRIGLEVRSVWRTRQAKVPVKKGPPLRFECCYRARSGPIGYLSSFSVTDVLSGYYANVARLRGRTPTFSIEVGGTKKEWRPPRLESEGPIWKNSLRRTLWGAVFEQRKRAKKGQKAGGKRVSDYLYLLGNWMSEAQRVASGRAPPERLYSRQEDNEARLWREKRLFSEVDPELLEPPENWRVPRGSKQQPGEVLRKGLESLGIATDIWKEDLTAYHSSILLSDLHTDTEGKIVDFGYGTSQVLPVLRALASYVAGPLFVEQPEIHLHPKAQADVGKMLVEASGRRQVFVETHSEHLINQARLEVARGNLNSEAVGIVYVSRDRFGSHATEIGLDSNGDFNAKWPRGFFDERYEDTMALASLKSSKKPAV
jgi:hypothetical protein